MNDELYKKAVDVFGESSQILMTIEEMSELSVELCHYLRGRLYQENLDQIAEEIADVELMLNQLKHIFGNEKKVKEYLEQKKERLKKTQKTTITCDYCGKVIDFDKTKIVFDELDSHATKTFFSDACSNCFDKLYKIIRNEMIEKKKKNLRWIP